MMINRSPSIQPLSELVGPEEHDTHCDGCGANLSYLARMFGADPATMLIGHTTVLCITCLEWALPQMQAVQRDSPHRRIP